MLILSMFLFIFYRKNMNKCCIVIITHKERLSGIDEQSFKRVFNVFNGKRDIKLILKDNISYDYYEKYKEKYDFEIIKVNHEWLDSLWSYNSMSCSKEFWEMFTDYDYVLTYHTDCWVFDDRLDYFMNFGYDWYGAPWPFLNNLVGNSGFSLRRVSKMLEITSKYKFKVGVAYDDIWFCKLHGDEMNICPWEIAVNFSLETVSKEFLLGVNTIPMGFHGKNLFNVWDDNGNKFNAYKNRVLEGNLVAACCIGRMENRYIKEYVAHYKKISIDKIFLYDNNHDGEERFEDVIGNEIDNGFVEIIDYRNKFNCQLKAYQDCYDSHKYEYDWIMFIDCGDEYLYMNGFDNIKDFLSQDKFKGFDLIHINLMNYGDNGLVKYDDRKLSERFTEPIIPLDFKKTYDFPENDHVSSIVRGKLNNVVWGQTPHTPSNKLKCCDASGNEQESTSPFVHPFDFSYAYFKHYTTKTIEEWYEIKSKRGYPDGNKEFFKTHDIFDEFFKWNNKTDDKMKYIESLGDYKSRDIKDILDIFICTHKNFKPLVSNPIYKIINSSNIDNDTWNGLNGSFYSEIMSYFYIANNYPIKEYVGFCHYRKYWKFLNEIPDIDKLINEHEVIAAKRIKFSNSIRRQYKLCHNIEDLYVVSGILAEKYHNYVNVWNSFLDGDLMFPYNMFIMKKEEFLDYIKFMRTILDEFVDIIGKNIEKRIYDNYEKYIKDFSPNDEIWYQYRIGGYLAERLTNVWLLGNHKTIATLDVIVTEDKYKKEEEKASVNNDNINEQPLI